MKNSILPYFTTQKLPIRKKFAITYSNTKLNEKLLYMAPIHKPMDPLHKISFIFRILKEFVSKGCKAFESNFVVLTIQYFLTDVSY